METLGIIAVVLFAVLVGAAIPALLQVRRTLKSAQVLLDRTGPKIDRIAVEAAQAVERVNRVSASVEDLSRSLQGSLNAIADLGRTLGRLRDHLQTAVAVGAALGPALAAGTRALFHADGDESEPDPREGDPAGLGQESGSSAPNEDHPGDDASPEEEAP